MTADTKLDLAVLPKVFQPVTGMPLVRLGRDFDGGYLIDARTLEHSDCLVSLGVGGDWSFDADFLAARPVPFQSYDGTVSHLDYLIDLYKRLVLFEPINLKLALSRWSRFYRFYRKPNRVHHHKYVSNSGQKRRISLAQLLDQNIPAELQRLFLSIDIEHAEYQLLDTLIERADRLEGVGIEFHDVDRNLGVIADFITRFPLQIAHVHVNNSGKIIPSGVPTMIEISFTRHMGESAAPPPLPHPLDRPNDPNKPEVAITFA